MSLDMRSVVPRQITASEIEFFGAHGWVHLPGLISEDDAALLLERLKGHMGEDAGHGEHPVNNGTTVRWRVFAPLSVVLETGEVRDELFHSFSHSRELGDVGTAFLGTRPRFWVDQSLVKRAAGEGSDETMWHIDIGDRENSPFVPGHQVNIWVALAEVTPEHGAMRFVAPQDVTDEVQELVKDRPVEDSYSDLEARGILSPSLHLTPGDATVHGGATFHSAPANKAGSPRWAYFVSLFPTDAEYSGHPFWPMVGVEHVEVGKTFPRHRFREL
jgi:Phytanoyl-CoA dioxygenase (PhyH)